MNKMKRRIFIFVVCFITLFAFASNGSALLKKNMRKVKNYMKAGQYPEAIAVLETAALENMTNANVHLLLGVSYMNNGNFGAADEVFTHAVRLYPAYGKEIGQEYKKAADSALGNRDFSSAGEFFKKAMWYDPELGQQEGYESYLAPDDKTGSPDVRKVAIKVVTSQDMKIIFEETYTFDNAFEKNYGQIKTVKFEEDNIQVGDEIEVIARLKEGDKFTGKEIGIWTGEDRGTGWVQTRHGYYTETVEKLKGDNLIISLAKRKDVEVTVRVKRRENHGPVIGLM